MTAAPLPPFPDLDKIISDIRDAAPGASADMTDELRERMEQAVCRLHNNGNYFFLGTLDAAAEEITAAEHRGDDTDALSRALAGQAILVACTIIHRMKRAKGDELSPGRMALVAYDLAEIFKRTMVPARGDPAHDLSETHPSMDTGCADQA